MIPSSLESLIQRAIAHQKRGDLFRACTIYNGLLRRGHRTARILTNLGAALYEAGNIEAGLDAFEAALELDPAYHNAWKNLSASANARDDWERVSLISGKLIEIDSGNYFALYAKAQSLMAEGMFAASQGILSQLLATHPDDLELREAIARCHLGLADYDSALLHLLYIVSLKPGDAFASIYLAEIAAKTGDLDSSMGILKSALALNPDDLLLIQRIAREHQMMGRMHEALSMFELALSIQPDAPVIMAKKAYCHSEIGEISTFFEIYDVLADRGVLTPEMLLSAIFVCSTQGEEYLEKLRSYSEQYWQIFDRLDSISTPAQAPQLEAARPAALGPSSPAGVRRKKIGILTGGLGTHVESCFLGSLLLNYSKDLLEVEVVSSRWLNDGISEVLASAADGRHSICDLSLQASRDLIRRQEYDVIIETTGFTSGTALHVLADRCAPVQCHWIGYHASTYMPTMDYFIGDSVLTPEAHAPRFSEQIVRLDRAWLAATPFTAIPEAKPSAEGEVILGCFSQMAKLTTQSLELWAQLLLSAPQSKLVFKDRFTEDSDMVARISSFFLSRGLDVEERLVFLPRSSDWFGHMAMYNQIDIALDTTPWSSATTAFDALSMGVPMISIKGATTSGLMSSSILHHCGRQLWIADNPSEYIEKNLGLIERIASLRSSKRALQAEILTSQLFDGVGVARAIENFFFSL